VLSKGFASPVLSRLVILGFHIVVKIWFLSECVVVLSRVTLPQSSVLVGCRFPIVVIAFYCQGKSFVRPTLGFVLYPKRSSVGFGHLFRDSHQSFYVKVYRDSRMNSSFIVRQGLSFLQDQ